ncbi:MAG: type VI secretion system-associated FHA domain protein TagH [Phyllobacteriaceae bacterium]|nr:type VI secretion system-associated FHA domain protein TagH [Phyllobacteriaceae bacterium]
MNAITLTIVNLDSLPDGGPIQFRAEGRGFEIGRDAQRDWALPDPRLFISSRHCEVRYEGGEYLLIDVSTNGTFVNGAQQRLKGAHRLRHGDKITIGNYIIEAAISAIGPPRSEGPWSAAPSRPAADDDDIWGGRGAAPPPIDRRQLEPPSRKALREADFIASHIDMPAGRSAFDAPDQQQTPHPRGFPASAAAESPHYSDAPAYIPPAPIPEPPRPATPARGGDGLAAFKLGARLPVHALVNRDQSEAIQEIGAIMLMVTEQVSQLLRARASAKAMARTSKRTMIGALDNNPLKFIPEPTEALEMMLSKDRPGYLDGMRAFREAFEDLKSHEMATYSAMQKALARLLEDLAPETIEAKTGKSAFSNSKAKAWEMFVARWEAKTEAHENGMLDVFLAYFAEAYQDASGKRR